MIHTCDLFFNRFSVNHIKSPTPEPTTSPIERVGKRCGGQRRPQCGSGQAGTRKMRAKCCPNDYGSFQYECVFVGESCGAPTPAPVKPVTPEPTPSPVERVGKRCGGQRMPQCGSGQAGTRKMRAKCCPNDFGSFQYECIFVGESCDGAKDREVSIFDYACPQALLH